MLKGINTQIHTLGLLIWRFRVRKDWFSILSKNKPLQISIWRGFNFIEIIYLLLAQAL